MGGCRCTCAGVCFCTCSLTYSACSAPRYCYLRSLWLDCNFWHDAINGRLFGTKLLSINCVFYFFLRLWFYKSLLTSRCRKHLTRLFNSCTTLTKYRQKFWSLNANTSPAILAISSNSILFAVLSYFSSSLHFCHFLLFMWARSMWPPMRQFPRNSRIFNSRKCSSFITKFI